MLAFGIKVFGILSVGKSECRKNFNSETCAVGKIFSEKCPATKNERGNI